MLSYLFAFSVRFYANAHSPRSGKGQLAQQVVSEQRERVVRFKLTRGAIVTGRFYNLWQKALFYKAFLSFWGKKLSERNNPTLCEPSGLEPSTIHTTEIELILFAQISVE